MKTQMKAIIASAVVIALALSAVAGVTYSWFSDSEDFNVDVTTASVDLNNLKIDELKAYSNGIPSVSDTNRVALVNGGYAETSVQDNRINLTISNIAPGEGVGVKISFVNNSSICTKYRAEIDNVESDLFSKLIFKFNGTQFNEKSEWIDLSKDKIGSTISTDLYIEIPNLGNEFQGKSCEFTIKIALYQSNYYEGTQVTVSSQEDLTEAFKNSNDSIITLNNGTYKIPSDLSGSYTIVGSGESTVIDCTETVARIVDITFSNVKIQGVNENYIGFQHSGNITYNNCIIDQSLTLYANNVVFNDCHFILTDRYIWTYGASNVTFDNCVFDTNGKSILVYNENTQLKPTISVTNCTFNATNGYCASAIDNQNCAAIEIDSTFITPTLNTHNNTVLISDDAFSGEWRIKSIVNDARVNEVTYKNITQGTGYGISALDGKIQYILNKKIIAVDNTPLSSDGVECLLSQNIKDIVVDLKDDNFEFKTAPYDQKPMGGNVTETITINGNGHKLLFNNTNSDWNNITVSNNAKLILNNIVLDNSGYNADGGTWNGHDMHFNCDVEMNNVTCYNAIALSKIATLNSVSISDRNATQDTYMVWIVAGADVTMKNCTIDGTSAVDDQKNCAIAIKDQYQTNPGLTQLKVENTIISSDKYAAVLVTSTGGANITWGQGNNIENTKDTENAVWYDGNGENITVDGCTKKAR